MGKLLDGVRGSSQLIETSTQKRLSSCYITVDFATAASQNGDCITQQRCHIIITVSYLICDKRQSKKLCFCHFLKNIGFVMQSLQIPRSVAATFLGRNPCPFSNLFLFLQARHVLYMLPSRPNIPFQPSPPPHTPLQML
jgi:hypothetical protein